MKLLSIRPSKYEGLYIYTVEHDGKRERYTLPDRIYEELGCPAVGASLCEDTYEALKSASAARDALAAALRTLAYGDRSRRELIDKLVHKGYARSLATETAEEAVRLGYINEERQLLNLIPYLANQKLYGARRIIPHLVNKGYHSSQIRAILSRLVEKGEIDFKESFNRLLEKTKTDPTDREARRALAYRYGFSS